MVPPARRRGFRIAIVIGEAFVLVMVGIVAPIMGYWPGYKHQLASLAQSSPLTGQWHLVAATKPYLTGDGLPMTDIFLEPSGRVMVHSPDDVLWRGGVRMDGKKHTLQLFSVGHDGAPVYAMTQPIATQLVLTPTGKDAKKDGALTLTRVPLPSHYPLLDRGLHFVNEWGLER